MAVPTEGVTRWFRDMNGRIHQINNVTGIVIGTPLVANGYYRDKPPVVIGGAAIAEKGTTSDANSVTIAGGVDPAVVDDTTSIQATGASSVLEDDDYNHEELRYVWAPVPIIFFQTTSDLAVNPTGSSFSVDKPDAPGSDFAVIDIDCAFGWDNTCGIFNSPPPGWAPGSSGND